MNKLFPRKTKNKQKTVACHSSLPEAFLGSSRAVFMAGSDEVRFELAVLGRVPFFSDGI